MNTTWSPQSDRALREYSPEGFNTFTREPRELPSNRVQIVFLGNSITRHGPAPHLGWNGNCGMAASDESRDFVHVVLRRLALRVESSLILNVADLERSPGSAVELLAVLNQVVLAPNALLVVQLGDNVSDSEKLRCFEGNLFELLDHIRSSFSKALLVSCWWRNTVKDEFLEATARRYNACFVSIGDLFDSKDNPDYVVKRFENQGVNAHPGNWGMHQIAIRIIKGLINNEE